MLWQKLNLMGEELLLMEQEDRVEIAQLEEMQSFPVWAIAIQDVLKMETMIYGLSCSS